ncbi:DUF3846 domain-containing protein [Streptomyces sp. LHD-70]|uniref:DUF3846 domain-containing protein n=1 Tax=Streptomyces sp. LHD-70 TaxID=3072140 RepID=UPI00280E90B1|nr:DUF3846 domain-containing protein [Streptomyces sp. LHD-70]MDQ8707586.1 DUF3846 domain-containing protein [Streptomyces sp. LHD-70]
MPNTQTTNGTSAFALLLRTDGTFTLLDWPTTPIPFEAIYTAINCDQIEPVTITPALTLWLDEDAPAKGAALNMHATKLHALNGHTAQAYYGNAVFTGGTDSHGRRAGLTPSQVLDLIEHHLTGALLIPAQRTAN